jgi:hypothetical protein
MKMTRAAGLATQTKSPSVATGWSAEKVSERCQSAEEVSVPCQEPMSTSSPLRPGALKSAVKRANPAAQEALCCWRFRRHQPGSCK